MSSIMTVLAPILVGLVYVSLCSLIREPARRRFNAVFVAGAGAAYLSGGGFGAWEFVFTAVITYLAYRGLESYAFIGVAWLLHTAWDALHHLYGNPIIPFAEHSSLGCAICDPVIALWCFAGGPSVFDMLRRRPRGRASSQRTGLTQGRDLRTHTTRHDAGASSIDGRPETSR